MSDTPFELKIIFPSEEAYSSFMAWFFDGGGEQGFLDSEEMFAEDRPPIQGFDFSEGNIWRATGA